MQVELYKHAISLNNLGVYMLQRGAAKQALETLRDAVDTLRACCALRDTAEHNTLLKAERRIQLAALKAMNPVKSGKPMSHEIICWEDLEVASSIPLTRAPAVFGLDCYVTFSLSHDEDIQERDRELDSSLMLYNYALAHIALINERNAAQVNRSALSLLRMSFAILFKKVEAGVSGEAGWDVGCPVESLTGLTIAVLSNLTNTLQREGREGEAQACHQKLAEIIEALSLVEEINLVYYSRAAAAAAAA